MYEETKSYWNDIYDSIRDTFNNVAENESTENTETTESNEEGTE